MLDAIQSTTSESSLTTSAHSMPVSFATSRPTSSNPHLIRSNSAKHARGGSVGLIDAARVRLTKDFPSLFRANSKSRHPKLRSSSEVQLSDILSAVPDYAKLYQGSTGRSSIDSMDHSGAQNERHGRSLGSRIVNFLSRSRSRSRSKKRRSRSLEALPDTEVPPMTMKTGSLGRHPRHPDLRAQLASTPATEPTPVSKPSTRCKSRPFFASTTNTDPTIQRRQKDLPSIPPQTNHSPQLLSPQPRPAMVHILNSPPLPRGEFARDGVEAPDSGDYGGRCSPLCLPQRLTPPGNRNKGKEKERTRSAKDREREPSRDRSAKDRNRMIEPHRIGSPILRERERDSRSAIGAVPLEKVASGSGNSRRSSGRESAAANAISVARVKRTKHGSFDFERPVSSSKPEGCLTPRMALKNMGITHESHAHTTGPTPMVRSHSLKAAPRSVAPVAGRGSLPAHGKSASGDSKSGSATDSWGRRKKLHLEVPMANATKPGRRGTDASNGSSHAGQHSAPSNRTRFAVPDVDPASPTSSNSQHSSSWGKSAGKHIARTTHGAFKFEPAVPTIPGSPATDERKSAARGSPGRSGLSMTPPPASPTKARPDRGKGRSLDLGLGLAWAPTKVREEAMLPRTYVNSSAGTTSSTSRVRGRYKGAWVDQDGRYELGLGNSQPPTGADVAEAFREALGDAAYSTFKLFVHRFDAHAIPLEGPYGLIYHARRLLDEANTLDERQKQNLVDRFVHFVRETQ